MAAMFKRAKAARLLTFPVILTILALAGFFGLRSLGVIPTYGAHSEGTVSTDTVLGSNTQSACTIDAGPTAVAPASPGTFDIEFCLVDNTLTLAAGMGAFQVNFTYPATLVKPIRNVTSGAGTSYFLEKCSGGGEPIAVMFINSAGDAIVGGSALAPVGTGCKTSALNPGGRLATVTFLCLGPAGTATITPVAGGGSFWVDSTSVNHNYNLFNAGSVTVTCPQTQQTFTVAPDGQSLCDPADILTLPGAAPAASPCSVPSAFSITGTADILVTGASLGLVTGCDDAAGLGGPAGGPPDRGGTDA